MLTGRIVSEDNAGIFTLFLNTVPPTSPAMEPPSTAKVSASTTLSGGLNANGAISPGIGDAVPGALLTIWNAAAEIPASPPPKKLEQYIGIGLAVMMSACVSGSSITAITLLLSPNFNFQAQG